jgi:hypothetical protein
MSFKNRKLISDTISNSEFKCSCGAIVKYENIPDFPGSKSGHIVYNHIPGPPCKDFIQSIEIVTKKHRGKVVQKP